MARVWSCGFETGTLGHELGAAVSGTPVIQSTRKRSGNYAFQCTQPNLVYRQSKTGLNLSTAYARLYLYTAAHTTVSQITIASLTGAGGNDILLARITGTSVAPAGRITLINASSGTEVVLGTGTAIINLNDWNLIELKLVVGAGTGIIESRINGVIDQTFTGLTTNGQGNFDALFFGTPIGGYQSNIYFDDLAIDNADYCGDSNIIARSPITGGTPTHNNWTKQSGTDAGAMWDETPFNATTYCTSSTSGQAQTAVMADFSATQTGHGSEIIASGANIHACKAAIVAKSNTAGSPSNIRRRINGVDTDTNITLTSTSDLYYETPIFTATPAAIDVAEVGAAHGSNTNLHTVEDVWLLVEYSAAFDTTGTLNTTEQTDTASFAAKIDLLGIFLTVEVTDTAVIEVELEFGSVYLDNAVLGPDIVLSNLNLTAKQTTASVGNARTNIHHPTGKYYYEFIVDVAGDKQVGICTSALPLTEHLGQNSLVSIGVSETNGWVGAGGIVTAPDLIVGHVYGVAVDIDAGKAWCKDITANGLWNENASSNPVTGAGAALFFVSNNPPIITSSLAVSIPENTTAVMTVTATDTG